ncbi:unnamed protein product, partial [marine sediment metagenome]
MGVGALDGDEDKTWLRATGLAHPTHLVSSE